MIAAIAIGLGMLDVILDGNNRNIILADQHIGNGINIINKGADYADSRNVVQILHHGFQRHREIAALKLFVQYLKAFSPWI